MTVLLLVALVTTAGVFGAPREKPADGEFLVVKRADYFQPIWNSRGFHIGGGQLSVWRPSSDLQGFHPLGDSLSAEAGQEPSRSRALLVLDANDGKVKAPIAIRIDSSYGNTPKQRAAGLTLYQLIAPPGYHCLGYAASKAHTSHRQLTLKDFEHYRCVRSDFAVAAPAVSIKKQLSIVDHYDPRKTYAQTVLWTLTSTSAATLTGLQSETLVANHSEKLFTLRSASLRPFQDPNAVLLTRETSDLQVVYRYDNLTVWNVNQCCSLGLTLTSSAEQIPTTLHVVEKPQTNGEAAPLAEPLGFLPIDSFPAFLQVLCPQDYVALSQILEIGRLKKHVRCIHQRYVAYGKWAPYVSGVDNVGFLKAVPVDEASSVGLSTLFVGQQSAMEAIPAPVLRMENIRVIASD